MMLYSDANKGLAEKDAYNRNQDEPVGTNKSWGIEKVESGHWLVCWKERKHISHTRP